MLTLWSQAVLKLPFVVLVLQDFVLHALYQLAIITTPNMPLALGTKPAMAL